MVETGKRGKMKPNMEAGKKEMKNVYRGNCNGRMMGWLRMTDHARSVCVIRCQCADHAHWHCVISWSRSLTLRDPWITQIPSAWSYADHAHESCVIGISRSPAVRHQSGSTLPWFDRYYTRGIKPDHEFFWCVISWSSRRFPMRY